AGQFRLPRTRNPAAPNRCGGASHKGRWQKSGANDDQRPRRSKRKTSSELRAGRREWSSRIRAKASAGATDDPARQCSKPTPERSPARPNPSASNPTRLRVGRIVESRRRSNGTELPSLGRANCCSFTFGRCSRSEKSCTLRVRTNDYLRAEQDSP